MVRSSILVLATLFLVFELVLPTPIGFGWWFGEGDGKDKDKDKDKDSKGFFDFWKLNQNDNKRDQGRKKIRFALLNRKNHSWAEIKNGSFPKGLWKKNGSLKLLFHSYSQETLRSSPDIIERQKIIHIGLAYGNASKESNVVVVDWTALSVEPEVQYNFVVGNVPIVGDVVASFLTKLVKTKRLANVSDVHMVGYGLGAHVAAVAAKKLQKNKKHGGKVGRITGLDPAGVGFDDETGQKSKNKSISLRKTDADFVDIIHCNLGASKTIQDAEWKGRYGSGVQAGHADFYPNGGTEQHGCKKTENVAAKDCHTKSCPEYFARSIEGVEYVGCPCQDYDELKEGKCNCTLADGGNLMGEPCSKEAKGKYFLTVTGTEKAKKKAKVSTTTTTAPPEIKEDKKPDDKKPEDKKDDDTEESESEEPAQYEESKSEEDKNAGNESEDAE